MNVLESPAAQQSLVGGRLCLDFINSVDDRLLSHPDEHLTSYTDLIAWSQHASILTEAEAGHLLAEAAEHPVEADAILKEAIIFREAFYRILLAFLANKPPTDADLAIFNTARSQALAHSEIAVAAEGFIWRWKIEQNRLGWILWPIIHSTADLLLSPDLKRVKQCSGPDCGWLFLDTSKNHTRRWCTMEGCGNRAKARSHYQRKRQSAQSDNHS
jgi:predicted RNA-binding Zn ribbon-like protein